MQNINIQKEIKEAKSLLPAATNKQLQDFILKKLKKEFFLSTHEMELVKEDISDRLN